MTLHRIKDAPQRPVICAAINPPRVYLTAEIAVLSTFGNGVCGTLKMEMFPQGVVLT